MDLKGFIPEFKLSLKEFNEVLAPILPLFFIAIEAITLFYPGYWTGRINDRIVMDFFFFAWSLNYVGLMDDTNEYWDFDWQALIISWYFFFMLPANGYSYLAQPCQVFIYSLVKIIFIFAYFFYFFADVVLLSICEWSLGKDYVMVKNGIIVSTVRHILINVYYFCKKNTLLCLIDEWIDRNGSIENLYILIAAKIYNSRERNKNVNLIILQGQTEVTYDWHGFIYLYLPSEETALLAMAYFNGEIPDEDLAPYGSSDELKKQTGSASLEDAFIKLTGRDIRDESSNHLDELRMIRRSHGH